MSLIEIDHLIRGVNAAVAELADTDGLIDQLRELMAERGQPPETMTSRRPPGTRPPWDVRVSNAYTSIHAWARHTEAELGTYVRGYYHRRLPGSDAHTKGALFNVAIFCEDEKVPVAEVRRVARAIGTLLRAAQSVPGIDLAPPPAATLRQACPYCQTGALTAAVDGSTEIYCANESCADPVTGLRPRWAKKDWPFLLSRLTQESA